MIAPPLADRRLRLLTRALIVYGAIGLAIAALALIVLLVGLGRVNALGDRLRDDASGVSAVLTKTADVLERAAGTADGIGGTIDTSTVALTSAATDLRQIEPRLRDIEARANAIDILGSQPLAPLAGLFGEIAGQLGDLDAQLDRVAANLTGNKTALSVNADSLNELAGQTRKLSAQLSAAELPSAIDDVRWLMVAMLGIGALGAAVPAAGALAGGLWLRRWAVGGPG